MLEVSFPARCALGTNQCIEFQHGIGPTEESESLRFGHYSLVQTDARNFTDQVKGSPVGF